MKLKLNKDGSAVVRNGAPVYVTHDGSEREIDGAAAMKLAMLYGRCAVTTAVGAK